MKKSTPRRPRKKTEAQKRASPSRGGGRAARTVEPRWTEVDRYFSDNLLGNDPVLESALESSSAAGLPAIAVSPNQGKLLQMLAQIIGARSILEIGTLGGYSTIWMARGLRTGGRVITLEVDAKHADVARKNFSRARLDQIIEVREGPALDTLPRLFAEGRGPFDLIFIDADKPNIPAYFDWSVNLSHPGSLIVVDNVVRDGEVINARSTDPSIKGVRKFVSQLAADPRVTGTAIQCVGTKGYDGFAVVLVK